MNSFFAQVTDGIVTKVAVVTAEFISANPERYEGEWIETFLNTEGKTYAGIGYTYDRNTNNFFAPPEPLES